MGGRSFVPVSMTPKLRERDAGGGRAPLEDLPAGWRSPGKRRGLIFDPNGRFSIIFTVRMSQNSRPTIARQELQKKNKAAV